MKVLMAAVAAVWLLASCNTKPKDAARKEDIFYTCSMHPQVMESQPGKCPICHMDLIAVKKTHSQNSGDLELTAQQIKLGNIRVDTIRSGLMGDEMVLNATLSIDQNRVASVNARVAGRIDKLYYKNVGDYVSKGAKLYEVYSEVLNNAKQEYLASLEKKAVLDNSLIDFDQLIQSAKNKLLLWGMSDAQIGQLAKTGKFSPTTTFYSSASGFITSFDLTEGAYAEEGGGVVRLADLSWLWAEAQLYSSQRSYLDANANAIVRFPDLPGKTSSGKIDFANPEVSPDSRINLLRVAIPNAGNELKPGMAAYVTLNSQASSASLVLPSDAVLQDGRGASVWIMTAKNTFRNQPVTIGLQNEEGIQITSGLKRGDVIVVSGAYLVNSEYIFRHGADPAVRDD